MRNPRRRARFHIVPTACLSTLVREAGYERISSKLLEELEDRMREAGIRTFPELTDPSNTRKTRIHFFDLNKPVPGFQQPQQLFAEEKELSRFLWMNRDCAAVRQEGGTAYPRTGDAHRGQLHRGSPR